MKRLAPFLILAAFFFGIAGGKGNHLPANLQVRASTPDDGPQLSLYLADEESSNKLDVDEQALTPPSKYVSFLEPSRKSYPPLSEFRPASSRHYYWLGLGCGGLPS
jgi:hypothetical protein